MQLAITGNVTGQASPQQQALVNHLVRSLDHAASCCRSELDILTVNIAIVAACMAIESGGQDCFLNTVLGLGQRSQKVEFSVN